MTGAKGDSVKKRDIKSGARSSRQRNAKEKKPRTLGPGSANFFSDKKGLKGAPGHEGRRREAIGKKGTGAQ